MAYAEFLKIYTKFRIVPITDMTFAFGETVFSLYKIRIVLLMSSIVIFILFNPIFK